MFLNLQCGKGTTLVKGGLYPSLLGMIMMQGLSVFIKAILPKSGQLVLVLVEKTTELLSFVHEE